MPAFETRVMGPAEIDIAVGWAADEGWNPGAHDARCFATVDPEGFLGGFLDGRPIASISVVNYDEAFAFLGFYIVPPAFRGQGYGHRLWQAAIAHAGNRLVGLDGVPDQQENYRRSGFRLAYRNVRYGGLAPGVAPLAPGWRLVEVDAVGREALQRYDRQCFPAPRPAFLDAWVRAPGHWSRAMLRDGRLAGYGVVRPCGLGSKIGPLFADDPLLARQLFLALAAEAKGEVFLDVPEPNAAAVALAEEFALQPVFETARMYTGPAPAVALDKVFGVTSFELG
jgi:GNAT superfamily N-acetyltransferase